MQNIGLVLAVLVTIGIVIAALHNTQGATTASPSTTADEPAFSAPPSMVVIGDSFTAGTGINSGPEWTQRLAQESGWVITPLATGGTGYLADALGAGTSFQERVESLPSEYPNVDYVVLAGGRNDAGSFPTTDIVDAARENIETVRGSIDADVILLSPFVSGEANEAQEELTAGLRRLARGLDVPFIDVTEMVPEDAIGEDGIHPTNRGHELIAERIEPELASVLGLSSNG